MTNTNTHLEADAINDGMVQAMDRRRLARPERRRTLTTPRLERRQICGYCFHPAIIRRRPSACARSNAERSIELSRSPQAHETIANRVYRRSTARYRSSAER
jgi:hypothetical protein